VQLSVGYDSLPLVVQLAVDFVVQQSSKWSLTIVDTCPMTTLDGDLAKLHDEG